MSKLFDCGETNDQPECTKEQIDQNLDAVHALGVRDMELVNKFDNALGGVAGDEGQTGVVTNSGNRYETGHFLGHADVPRPQRPGGARPQPDEHRGRGP